MSEHVYKIIELVGSSTTGIEDAIQNAVNRAAQTIRNMRWFEVVETRGHIANGQVAHYQVTLKIGFTLDDASQPAFLHITCQGHSGQAAASVRPSTDLGGRWPTGLCSLTALAVAAHERLCYTRAQYWGAIQNWRWQEI